MGMSKVDNFPLSPGLLGRPQSIAIEGAIRYMHMWLTTSCLVYNFLSNILVSYPVESSSEHSSIIMSCAADRVQHNSYLGKRDQFQTMFHLLGMIVHCCLEEAHILSHSCRLPYYQMLSC